MNPSGRSPCVPRLALVGCGAITESVHGPSLVRLSNAGLLRVVAVVDPSEERRDRVAALFKSEPASLPVEAINSSVADAALVASPAAFHQEQCLKLLSAGVNVLCEKPLGLSTDEVLQITKTADRFGKKCAVGLQRRFWDSCVGIEGASRAGWIGKPVRVEISAGGPFGWSAATDSFFRKETAGGGTLLDLGIHLIDILVKWFGECRVTSYEDDSMGGIESTCVLRVEWAGGLRGEMRLTREFTSSNLCRIIGESGELVWNVFCQEEFFLRDESGWKKVLPGTRPPGFGDLGPLRAVRSQDRLWLAFLDLIAGGHTAIATAPEMPSCHRVIDSAYENRQRAWLPWIPVPRGLCTMPVRSAGRRVAILGASGFIGGRLCQVALECWEGRDLVPIVRRATGLANLARLPVKWRRADAFDPASLISAFEGCEVVVDALMPGLTGIDKAALNVAQAAEKAGVRRLIYLSSQTVFGPEPAQGTDERTPLPSRCKDPYSNGKIRAERALRRFAAKSDLEIIILRPGIVYGPGSRWISTLADRFERGEGWVVRSGEGICNAIYVDNLVHAIGLAMDSPPLVENGRAYFVNDAEPLTWRDYCAPIAAACGVGIDTLPDAPAATRGSALDAALAMRSRIFVRMMLPLLPARLKRAVRSGLAVWSEVPSDEPGLYETRPSRLEGGIDSDPELAALQCCRWRFPTECSRKDLGFQAPIPFAEGMARSLEWWRFGKGFLNSSREKGRDASKQCI
ncbi:MAG: NAD-dependent epimerase/dehydratase family protein [Verrucomicrobiia bacterium]